MCRNHRIKNLPEVFTNYFVINNQVHQHNTSNATQLHQSYRRTTYVKHTLSNKAVDIWNDLESNLKNIKSCNIFKNMIKKKFLQIFQISHNFQLCTVIYCTVDSFVYCRLVGIWQLSYYIAKL